MPDMKAQLNLLTDEVQRGLLYYGVAVSIREQARAPEFNRAPIIFNGSYYACIRECVLAIAKLIVFNDDSLGIEKLLNYVEQNVGEFPLATPEEVRKLVSESRDEIRALEPLAQQVEHLRDKELAHLDRVHLKAPESIIPVPIPYDDLRDCLNLLIRVLNQFLAMHGSPQILFEDYRARAGGELAQILAALKKGAE